MKPVDIRVNDDPAKAAFRGIRVGASEGASWFDARGEDWCVLAYLDQVEKIVDPIFLFVDNENEPG